MVTAELHILYDIGGYLIVSGSWKYLPLLFVMKILAPFQESHSQYFVDIDDNDTSRDLNVWCRPWHTNSQIFIFTAPKLRYLNHLLQFFHDGIPSFEILEGWSMGDPFKETKGDWSTLVNLIVGKTLAYALESRLSICHRGTKSNWMHLNINLDRGWCGPDDRRGFVQQRHRGNAKLPVLGITSRILHTIEAVTIYSLGCIVSKSKS